MIDLSTMIISKLKLSVMSNKRLFKHWQSLSIDQQVTLWPSLSGSQCDFLIGEDDSLFREDKILSSEVDESEWTDGIRANDECFSIGELNVKWDALSDEERDKIYADFNADCLDSAREPCSYWYPLLMPWFTKNYNGN